MEIINTRLLNLHNVTMEDAINTITKYSTTPTLDIVVTPNIDHLARIVSEGATSPLKAIYSRASLCLCDSRILAKLLHFKDKRVKEVITGSTLTKNLFDSQHMLDRTILVVGGENSVFNKLLAQYPHLDLHHINPPMGFINDQDEINKVIDYAEQVQPHYLFLAVGSPRQEVLAEQLRLTLTKGVALCVGASILFLVGAESRAPYWVQCLSLEWCYRICQNPKVLAKRYFSNSLKLRRIFSAL